MATRGRKPRRRKAGSGSSVRVKGHGRSPRGSNSGKPSVAVNSYKRGKLRRRRQRAGGTRRRRKR